MKIAKKVLAVAMAVAMIACFAAMAFAAEDKIVLKASEITEGKFTVQVVATGYADLKAADWVVKYDPAVVSCAKAKAGAGVTEIILNSELITAFNIVKNEETSAEVGEVKVGYAFTNTLDTNDDAILFTLDFTVVDANAADAVIELTGSDTAKATVVINEVEETTAAPETTTEEITEAAPSTPAETTKPGVVEGPNTGDTGVLAIAAGVVALAGAAFVVSKKRK